MNTVRADRDGVRDTIADPDAAARWLRQARPGLGIAGWEAVAELRDLRDALRHLAAAATADDRPTATTTTATATAATAATADDRHRRRPSGRRSLARRHLAGRPGGGGRRAQPGLRESPVMVGAALATGIRPGR